MLQFLRGIVPLRVLHQVKQVRLRLVIGPLALQLVPLVHLALFLVEVPLHFIDQSRLYHLLLLLVFDLMQVQLRLLEQFGGHL